MAIQGLPLGLQTQAIDFSDFSGGMTDNYVGALLNQFQRGDNLLITANKQLLSRAGSQLIDPVNNRPAANRIGRIFNYIYDDTLLYQSAQSFYYGTSLTPLNGPSGNQLLPLSGVFNQVSYGYWNGFIILASDALDRPIKIYKDPGGTIQARTAGLPKLSGTPTYSLQAGNVGTTHSYIYRFHYEWQCQVGAVGPATFANFGPTTNGLTVTTAHAIDGTTPFAISVFHNSTLSNGTSLNYELSGTGKVQVWIFRSSDGGTTWNLVGTKAHDDVSAFIDAIPDSPAVANLTNPGYSGSYLTSGQGLYTTGGVLDSNPPPPCKFVHVCLNRAYYGYIQNSDGSISKNIVQQSVDGQIDACPQILNAELEEEIRGISSVLGRPIVLCIQKVYRLDGEMDETGQGVIQPVRISDIAGCISNQSIVQTQEGIFWAGNDGFYFTDGYVVKKISEHLNESYQAIISNPQFAAAIQGVYDPKNRRIWWTVQTDGSSPDCDTCWVLDLKFGITPQSPFTTVSGGESFSPSSILFYKNNLLRGDHRGYILEHLDTLTNDPQIVTSTPTSGWTTEAIIYDYIGPATNFGSNQYRKWVPIIITDCKNLTNLSLQVISNNDDGRQILNCAPIRYRGNLTWGDSEVEWGSATTIWNVSGLIEKKLNFPGRAIRCSYKQVEFTNANVIVTNSDTLGTVTVTPNRLTNTGTVALNTASVSWPSDPTGQYLTFQFDNYTTKYLILSRTPTTLTYQDTNNTSVSGLSIGWEITGIPKDEVFHLISYTFHYAVLSATQNAFATSDLGAN